MPIRNNEITPVKVQTILKQDGINVSLEHAKAIQEFLNILAEISLAIYMNGPKNNP